jgi:hypothetical protein
MYYTLQKGRYKINGGIKELMFLSNTMEGSGEVENYKDFIGRLDIISHNLRLLSEDVHGLISELGLRSGRLPTRIWSQRTESALETRNI